MLKRTLPCALWIAVSALVIEAGSPIAKFSRPSNTGPFGITLSTDPAAPNGDLWFTEFDGNRIGYL
jgi:streptogramin lyase